MSRPTLIIGNRNYSSWSLRAWLALEATGLHFDEIVVQLGQPDTEEQILRHSPTARVPAFSYNGILIWDSLAICEYLAEASPRTGLWPSDPAARATARSVVAEMHSGFVPLRKHMPMNVRASHPGAGRGPGVEEDIARIAAIWDQCRHDHGLEGDLLFGGFTIADAFFAPIVSRFRTYGVTLDGAAGRYLETVWSLPAMVDWVEKALEEPWSVARYDL